MILLTIDIGNTNITCGIFRGERLLKKWYMPKDLCTSASWLRKRLARDIGARRMKEIEGVCICSVVSGLNNMFRKACGAAFGRGPLFATAKNAGLRIPRYNRRQLGADRIVAALSAYEKYKKALIVIDAGSAMTIDLVTARGEFAGGVIVPGMNAAARALHYFTEKLPMVIPTASASTLGRNTKGAIRAGLCHGYAGLVDQLVQEISKEARLKPLVIATGGEARLLKKASGSIDRIHGDLILKGLRMVWERNLLRSSYPTIQMTQDYEPRL
jgi:type III pantothenate kinase